MRRSNIDEMAPSDGYSACTKVSSLLLDEMGRGACKLQYGLQYKWWGGGAGRAVCEAYCGEEPSPR